MLAFSCLACHKKLQVKDEHAGKKVKCPGCGEPVIVPTPTVDIPPPMAEILSAPPEGEISLSEVRRSHDPGLFDFLAPAQADDELGRLGKYRVLGVLGHGGMGVVYRAEDVLLKRTIALKAILPSLGASESARKRFLREARTMGQLEHDHVVRLYEVGEDRGAPYLAMELLAGEPLDQRLANERILPLADAVRIGREIAEGLAAAHARDLIHRDIKPANIFLAGANGRVKILDFGLARAVEEDSRITQSGAILGTPAFMAPEQTRGEKADFRADLFSFGGILYRMCAGENPFSADDALSTMIAVATKDPISPQLQNYDVPPELSDLIMQLLEKDPARRCGSTQEVVDRLKQIEKQLSSEAEPTGPASKSNTATTRRDATPAKATDPATPPKPARGFPWLMIALVLGALLLCVIGGILLVAFLL